MDQICVLLEKYHICWNQDEGLELPHIVYEQKASDNETVISHNFVVRYSDLTDRELLVTENLERKFYDFEKKYFSRYFFREDTDLKWNYYLLIIVNEQESLNSNICQLEQDDKYLRKLVMTEEEFEVYISHGRNMNDSFEPVISGMDTYAEWQKELSEVGLDGILANSYESIKVQKYIEEDAPIRMQGRPIRNWENTGKGDPRFLVKRIESLRLEKFRDHCLASQLEIPLTNVNLISGCNGTGKSSVCSAIEYALTGEILDAKEERGTAKVRIKNLENAFEELGSAKLTREKKALDQLWYGTATIARNSSLNRNFHIFNYLGLEASGRYMQELDINALVKNVLFGFEVTEAEQKMHRYGKAFADKKKEYGKRLKDILQEIKELQVDDAAEGISVEEITHQLDELGYRGKPGVERQKADSFLRACRRILNENNAYVDRLLRNCEEDETGAALCGHFEKLREEREAYRALNARREKLRQDIQESQQISQDVRRMLDTLYESIQKAQMLIRDGAELKHTFYCMEDFWQVKSEYENNRITKEALLDWLDQFQTSMYQEGNENDLSDAIQAKGLQIDGLINEIRELESQIDFQKKQNENIDIIIREILTLAEQYGTLDEHVRNCPVCGTDLGSRENLMQAVHRQRQLRVVDETRLDILLKQRAEKETALNTEQNSLSLLRREREKAAQKSAALAKLRSIMPLDDLQGGTDVVQKVTACIEQIQRALDSGISRYEYAQKVIEIGEFPDYQGKTDWIGYLEKSLQSLNHQKDATEALLKNQTAARQQLEREYQAAMEEKAAFSEQEWEECRIKADAFQMLGQTWEIDKNISIKQWLHGYSSFQQQIQYAEDIFERQETLRLKKERLGRFEQEKELVEKWYQNCQTACAVIERQKRLQDVMKAFLNQNAKQIELFFKLLHRPKEFGKLSIEEGNIRFMRSSSGQFAESSQMSTGQRMALAFSVMITLHIRAANAPNFLMLDEPVANLDDMHVLNLIDLLRELAISGTQIIITTADSQMAKFLRRKFSFLKDEYSHLRLTRKGNEQTLIEVIHYRPDMKAEADIQPL